jgi:hypothetical protein
VRWVLGCGAVRRCDGCQVRCMCAVRGCGPRVRCTGAVRCRGAMLACGGGAAWGQVVLQREEQRPASHHLRTAPVAPVHRTWHPRTCAPHLSTGRTSAPLHLALERPLDRRARAHRAIVRRVLFAGPPLAVWVLSHVAPSRQRRCDHECHDTKRFAHDSPPRGMNGRDI